MDNPIAVRSRSRREFLTRSVPTGALCAFVAGSVASAEEKSSPSAEPAAGASAGVSEQTAPKLEQMLHRYADVVVKVGLNLRAGQRLLIVAPLETAPLVRQVTISAYRAGARLVDAVWGDQQMNLLRFQHAPAIRSANFPTGRPRPLSNISTGGTPSCTSWPRIPTCSAVRIRSLWRLPHRQ